MQNHYHLSPFPIPRVHGPYESIWKGLALVDSPHTAVDRGSNSALRKGSRADTADTARAPSPKAMSGDIVEPPLLLHAGYPHINRGTLHRYYLRSSRMQRIGGRGC